MRQRAKSIMWGLLFIAAAAFIVLQIMGIVGSVSIVKIIFTVVFAGIIISSIPYGNFFGIFMPLSIICIMFAKDWGFGDFSPWAIAGIGLCLSIGFGLIFKSGKKKQLYVNYDGNNQGDRGIGAEYINNAANNHVDCSNSFGSSVKYVRMDNLASANLKSQFGEMCVYFDGSRIPMGRATIDVDCKFGELEIHVPRDWRVNIQAKASLGNIKEINNAAPVEGSPEVVITGSVAFGEVQICHN